MVKFLEGNGDFIDFDGDESDDSCTCKCNECGIEFTVGVDEEPDQCPSCGTEFDFGNES